MSLVPGITFSRARSYQMGFVDLTFLFEFLPF